MTEKKNVDAEESDSSETEADEAREDEREVAAAADDESSGDESSDDDSDDDDSDDDDSDDDDSDDDDSDDEDSDDDDSDDDDSDDDDSDDDEGEERAAAARPGPPAAAGDDPQSRMIVLAVVVVCIAGGAFWYWQNGRHAAPEEAPEIATEAPSVPGAPTDPAEVQNPFAQGEPPARPAPIPAPSDVAAPPDDAVTTESGLASKVITPGTGDTHPAATDRVTVQYTGWTTDGQMFDSSRTRGEPATFNLDGVIPGWTEGVQLMVTGETRRLWVPQDLAYRGRPGAPQGMLVFDVELISFETPPPPPATPEHLDAPAPGAERLESGVASLRLQEGTGDEHPTDQSLVRFNLTGWKTDGEMFDSTVTRERPLTLPLGQLAIAGLREGIQLMVAGEKRRFWVPEAQAFAGRPGAPPGDLVFDIELLDVREMPQMPPGFPGMPGMGGPGGPRPGGPPGGPPGGRPGGAHFGGPPGGRPGGAHFGGPPGGPRPGGPPRGRPAPRPSSPPPGQ